MKWMNSETEKGLYLPDDKDVHKYADAFEKVFFQYDWKEIQKAEERIQILKSHGCEVPAGIRK